MEKRKRYIVTHPFRDLHDKSIKYPNGKPYAIGDVYIDLEEQEKRIEELAGDSNNVGKPIIMLEVAEKSAKVANKEPLESSVSDLNEDVNTLAYDEITKDEIISELENLEIDHVKRDSKRELFELLKKER